MPCIVPRSTVALRTSRQQSLRSRTFGPFPLPPYKIQFGDCTAPGMRRPARAHLGQPLKKRSPLAHRVRPMPAATFSLRFETNRVTVLLSQPLLYQETKPGSLNAQLEHCRTAAHAPGPFGNRQKNQRTRSAHSPILGTGEPGSEVLRKDRPERLDGYFQVRNGLAAG